MVYNSTYMYIRALNMTTFYFYHHVKERLSFLFDDAKLRHKKRCMKQRHAPLSVFL